MIHQTQTRSSFALIAALLALSACGKNMHVTWKNGAVPQNQPSGPIDTTRKENQKDALNGPGDVRRGTTESPERLVNPAIYDGDLHAYSKYDLSELSGKRPFLNDDDATNAIRMIGEPAYLDEKTEIGFVKDSNLLFRAIRAIPRKEDIKEVTEFKLVLKGLRLYKKDGSALKEADLSEQVLCVADTMICSGQVPGDKKNQNQAFWGSAKVVNDVFSQIKLPQLLNYGEQGAVFEGNQEVTLDMKTLFGLEKLSTGQLIDWIYENSTEYAEPGYRKFRFAMGNNLFLEAGTLNLQFLVNTPQVNEAPGALKHGADDSKYNEPSKGASVAKEKESQDKSADQDREISPDGSRTSDQSDVTAGNPVSSPEVTEPATSSEAPAAPIVTQASNDSDSREDVKAVSAKPVSTLSSAKSTPSEIPLVVIQTRAGMPELKLSLDGAHLTFEFDSARIRADGKEKLTKTSKLLMKHYGAIAKIKVSGHTDKVGRDAYNLELSKKRATAAATVLVKGGIPNDKKASKFVVKGFGEPAKSSCHPKQPCSQDRRVDIEIKLQDSLSAADKSSVIQALNQGLTQIWK